MFTFALINREFRVISRQKRLYFFRIIIAIILSFILLIGIGIHHLARGSSGSGIFASLSFTIFFFASLLTVSQSCGAISDEKRKGTLGLLLLTPLRPLHVVFSKFLARCCEALQFCMVVFPLIFVSFALGGLTAGQILAAFVVILAQVILCAGTTVMMSSLFRNAASAFLAAALFISGVEVLGLIAVSPLGIWAFSGFRDPIWTFLNPIAAIFKQFSMGSGDLSWSFVTLGFSSLLALGMLQLTAIRVQRNLTADFEAKSGPVFSRRFRKSKCRADECAPIYWLEWGRWKSRRNVLMFSCLLLVASVSIYVHFWWTGIIGDIIQVINYGAGLFTSLGAWLVSMIMAIEMVRNLQNQKQERVFELMLTTPITDQDWIRQRLKAAWKAYGIPILLLGVLGLVLAGDFQMATLNDKPLSLSEKGVHGIVLLGSCISQWYFFATLSLFVGLSSRTMGNAVGTFILIYFGFHIVSSIFGAILTLLFILPSYFLSFFKNQMFLMSILASIPTIGMQVLVGWLFHDLLKKSFRKWTTES